ncbi:MAG TPA: hypothetical protein VFC46_10425, partial [Humisphaera sp.]|nr:hypothetical protein [Humisphaera sp.]
FGAASSRRTISAARTNPAIRTCLAIRDSVPIALTNSSAPCEMQRHSRAHAHVDHYDGCASKIHLQAKKGGVGLSASDATQGRRIVDINITTAFQYGSLPGKKYMKF